MSVRKIIVAVTGASGAVYALKLLERLRGLAESLPGQGEHSRGQVKPLSGHSMNTHAQAETIPGQTEQPRELPEPPAEVAVIFTGNAEEIMLYETGAWYKPSGTETIWDNNDFNAPFASGSSSYDTMIICPASMGMVGRIAHGVSDDLDHTGSRRDAEGATPPDSRPPRDTLQSHPHHQHEAADRGRRRHLPRHTLLLQSAANN